MTIDVGNDFLQQLIVLMHIILIYVSKAIMWIGVIIVSKHTTDLITQGRRRDKFTTIVKGIIMILFSIILYFILV